MLAHAVRATNYSVSAAPVICRDVVVVGASIHDGPTHKEWPRGDVSGFDVRTGKRLWTIHSIPQKGEFGNETWGDDSWTYTGSTNVWTNMSADEELGYVYLPFGTPTDDFYGGHRPGANLFAETLLALDAKTGKRVWHFQGVHHGVWDYDFPAAPILVDINVNGKPIKARRAGQQAGLHLRVRSQDRRAGVADRRTAGAAIDGARRAHVADAAVPDQAAGLRTAGRDRRRSDRLHAGAESRRRSKSFKQFDTGPLFTPPSEKGTIVRSRAGPAAPTGRARRSIPKRARCMCRR